MSTKPGLAQKVGTSWTHANDLLNLTRDLDVQDDGLPTDGNKQLAAPTPMELDANDRGPEGVSDLTALSAGPDADCAAAVERLFAASPARMQQDTYKTENIRQHSIDFVRQGDVAGEDIHMLEQQPHQVMIMNANNDLTQQDIDEILSNLNNNRNNTHPPDVAHTVVVESVAEPSAPEHQPTPADAIDPAPIVYVQDSMFGYLQINKGELNAMVGFV